MSSKILYKKKASAILREAIRNDKIIKPIRCEKCQKETPKNLLSGHHDDYNKPLKVKWFCPSCHVKREVELGIIYGLYKGHTKGMNQRFKKGNKFSKLYSFKKGQKCKNWNGFKKANKYRFKKGFDSRRIKNKS